MRRITLAVPTLHIISILVSLTVLPGCSSVGNLWRDFRGEREDQIVDGPRRRPPLNPNQAPDAIKPEQSVAPYQTPPAPQAPVPPPAASTPTPYDSFNAEGTPATVSSKPGLWDRITGWVDEDEPGRQQQDQPVAPAQLVNEQPAYMAPPTPQDAPPPVELSRSETPRPVQGELSNSEYPPLSSVPPTPQRFSDVSANRAAQQADMLSMRHGAQTTKERLDAEVTADAPESLLAHSSNTISVEPALAAPEAAPAAVALTPKAPPPAPVVMLDDSEPQPLKPVSEPPVFEQRQVIPTPPESMAAPVQEIPPPVEAAAPLEQSYAQPRVVPVTPMTNSIVVPQTPHRQYIPESSYQTRRQSRK